VKVSVTLHFGDRFSLVIEKKKILIMTLILILIPLQVSSCDDNDCDTTNSDCVPDGSTDATTPGYNCACKNGFGGETCKV